MNNNLNIKAKKSQWYQQERAPDLPHITAMCCNDLTRNCDKINFTDADH